MSRSSRSQMHSLATAVVAQGNRSVNGAFNEARSKHAQNDSHDRRSASLSRCRQPRWCGAANYGSESWGSNTSERASLISREIPGRAGPRLGFGLSPWPPSWPPTRTPSTGLVVVGHRALDAERREADSAAARERAAPALGPGTRSEVRLATRMASGFECIGAGNHAGEVFVILM